MTTGRPCAGTLARVHPFMNIDTQIPLELSHNNHAIVTKSHVLTPSVAVIF